MFKNFSRVRALNKKLEQNITLDSLAVFSGIIKQVLILVNSDNVNYQDGFKDLHIALGANSQDIHILRFKDKISKKEDRPFDVITPDQFDRKGLLLGDFAPYNSKLKYDLVIAYYERPQLFLNSIVQNQTSAFKVGLQDNHAELFHFMLTTKTSQIELFIAELLRYLRILKHID